MKEVLSPPYRFNEVVPFESGPPNTVTSRVELNRLRWRCRRGMLENDLILERFLDARGEAITDREIAALDRLLKLGDNELWDLLSGRQESEDEAVKPLLEALRAI